MPDKFTYQPLTRWWPYGVYPSDLAAGRPKPAIVELRLAGGTVTDMEPYWPIDVVLTELADRAIAWYRHAIEISTRVEKLKRPTATPDELRQWIASTYALADRLPHVGGTTADQMRTAAAQLERTLDSPQQFFIRWPNLGTTADAQKRASLHLWAIDQLVRHVNDADAAYAQLRGAAGVVIPLTALWPALFARAEPIPPFADYADAMKRVRKLEKTVRTPDALIAALLADVITHGRLGPDGQPRT